MTEYTKPSIFRLGEAVLLIAGGVSNLLRNEVDANGMLKIAQQSP